MWRESDLGGPRPLEKHIPEGEAHEFDYSTGLRPAQPHNQQMGRFDETFRFYLQARGSNPDALQELKTTTFRGLINPKASGLVMGLAKGAVRLNLGTAFTFALRIDPQEQNLYFDCRRRGNRETLSFSKDFMTPGLDYVALHSVLDEY